MLSRRDLLEAAIAAAMLVPAAAIGAAANTPPVRMRPSLTAAAAQHIAAACRREAEAHGFLVSIAVVDAAGALLYFERLEGASPLSAEMAIGKARSSAALRKPSGTVGSLVKEMPGLMLAPGVPLRGAVPLLWQGECVGAVGVSGMSAEQDEQIATAGAAALA